MFAHALVVSAFMLSCSSRTETRRTPSPCESLRPDVRITGDLLIVSAGSAAPDPQHFMAEVTALYPGNPARVARTLEGCVAPIGNDCERIAAIATVFPGLMRNTHLASAQGYVEACRHLPAALRRCLFPSHSLSNPADCAIVDSFTPMRLRQDGATPSPIPQPTAPVIVVTSTSISIDGTEVATVAEASRGDGVISSLASLPKPGTEASLFLQAGTTTSAVLINRIVNTAQQAGYRYMMFVVTKP